MYKWQTTGGPPDFFEKHVGVSYFKPISQYGNMAVIFRTQPQLLVRLNATSEDNSIPCVSITEVLLQLLMSASYPCFTVKKQKFNTFECTPFFQNFCSNSLDFILKPQLHPSMSAVEESGLSEINLRGYRFVGAFAER